MKKNNTKNNYFLWILDCSSGIVHVFSGFKSSANSEFIETWLIENDFNEDEVSWMLCKYGSAEEHTALFKREQDEL